MVINKDEIINFLNITRSYLFYKNENDLVLSKDLFKIYISDDINHFNHFYNKLNNIITLLEQDIQMTYDSDPAATSKEEIIITYPGILAISTYRISHELYLMGLFVTARIMSEAAHSATGIDIHPGALILDHFFIDHGTGIVIGETSVIGHNVKIYQGVTIGALSLSDGHSLHGKKRHPTIGDNVTIYANASILGGDTIIGNNVTIGGNVFITKSIPSNMVVLNKEPELIVKNK